MTCILFLLLPEDLIVSGCHIVRFGPNTTEDVISISVIVLLTFLFKWSSAFSPSPSTILGFYYGFKNSRWCHWSRASLPNACLLCWHLAFFVGRVMLKGIFC